MTFIAIVVLVFSTSAVTFADIDKPNIVILLADDQGWADVGFHSGRIKTPNLDTLAKHGVELDRFYVYPICSPTRAAHRCAIMI